MENNNPQAFPRPASLVKEEDDKSYNTILDGQKGMTLRDFFAAKAMQGLIGSPTNDIGNGQEKREELASISYKIADAMLKKRE